MKEIDYCISIINLFENKDIDNSSILDILLERKYYNIVKKFDKIKVEQGKPAKEDYLYGSNIPAFDENYYENLFKKAINALSINIDKGRNYSRYEYGFLNYIHRLEALFRAKNLDEKQMFSFIEKIDYSIGRKHLLVSLLEYLKYNKKWSEMEYYIQKMPIYYASEFSYKTSDEHTSMYGYRIKIYEYIENINLKQFVVEYKKCKPVYDKYQMSKIKDDFMFNFSKKYGHKKAIGLTNKAPFKNYELIALLPYTQTKSFLHMKRLIEKYPKINTSKKHLREQLLVATLENLFKNSINVDKHIILLIEDIKKIDRKIRTGDLKLKDSLFLDLGCSTKDLDLITICKKLIGYNLLKQELKLWAEQIKNNTNNE